MLYKENGLLCLHGTVDRHDILVSVKRISYQYYMAQLGTDVNAVKKAVEGKKALEELQRARISLE